MSLFGLMDSVGTPKMKIKAFSDNRFNAEVGEFTLMVNPENGKAVVLRPVDWGPNIRTRRIIDVSPQALRDLGMSTDENALVAFVKDDTPLGVVR